MLKKTLLAIFFMGILISLLSCSGGATTETIPTENPTKAPDIRISADGSGDYPDLETAIDQANPGEIIFLEAGTYRLEEHLTINKSIVLTGNSHENTIIISSAEGSALRFTGDGPFALEGITVQHDGAVPAVVISVENGEINFSNCHITGAIKPENALSAGLAIAGSATGSVKNCIINKNSNIGIILAGDSDILLEGNTCADNYGIGIYFRENASGEVRNNACNNNDYAGFLLDGDGEVLLENNQCSHNGPQDEMGGGILIRGKATPVLNGNSCNNNPHLGIAFGGSSGGNANDNDCSQNGFAGIYLEGEANPALTGNTCNENGKGDQGIGIIYFNQSGGLAIGNVTNKNYRAGIVVLEEATPELLQNECNENTAFGINYNGTLGGSATKNQCASNGQIGIIVASNSTPRLQENSCYGNQAGIYIAETANPELVDNDLHDNSQDDLVDLRP